MSNRDYEVGRGKPPVHTRFQKGRSGNPSGRKKSGQTLDKLVSSELERTMVITDGAGRRQRITMLEAMAKSLVRDAIRGDKQSLKIVAEMQERAAAVHAQVNRPPVVIELDMTI